MACINKGSQSLLATHTFIDKWNGPSCLYSQVAEHHRILIATHFQSQGRLGLGGWLPTAMVYQPEDGHRSHLQHTTYLQVSNDNITTTAQLSLHECMGCKLLQRIHQTATSNFQLNQHYIYTVRAEKASFYQ